VPQGCLVLSDTLIIPKDINKLGLNFRIQSCTPQQNLNRNRGTSLSQLRERRYETILQQKGITNILQIGLAFCGKEVELISNRLN
jgi:hypothetical protein